MTNSRRKWKCLDCQEDTGKMHEHYFINTETWISIVGSKVGMLCIGCCEKRLGRMLVANDFPPVTINNPKYENKSQRLMARLNNTG